MCRKYCVPLLPSTGSCRLKGQGKEDGLKLPVRGFSDSSGLNHFPSDFGGKLISLSGCLLGGRNGWISPNTHSLLLPLITEPLSFSQVHGCPTKDCISEPPLKPGMAMCLSSGQQDVIYMYIFQLAAWNVTWCGAILDQIKPTI